VNTHEFDGRGLVGGKTELGVLLQGCLFESGTESLWFPRISVFPTCSMQSLRLFYLHSKSRATCLYKYWHQKRTWLQMDCSFTMNQEEVANVYLYVDKGRR